MSPHLKSQYSMAFYMVLQGPIIDSPPFAMNLYPLIEAIVHQDFVYHLKVEDTQQYCPKPIISMPRPMSHLYAQIIPTNGFP